MEEAGRSGEIKTKCARPCEACLKDRVEKLTLYLCAEDRNAVREFLQLRGHNALKAMRRKMREDNEETPIARAFEDLDRIARGLK